MSSISSDSDDAEVRAKCWDNKRLLLGVLHNLQSIKADLVELKKKNRRQEISSGLNPALNNNNNNDDDELGSTKTEPLKMVIENAIAELYGSISGTEVGIEFVLHALGRFYYTAGKDMLSGWADFQEQGVLGFGYCLYGVFYFGHKHARVAGGKCYCRLMRKDDKMVNGSTRCIRVKRDEREEEDQNGKLYFYWGKGVLGPCPDLTHWE